MNNSEICKSENTGQTWREKLNARLTDEFRYKLNETKGSALWMFRELADSLKFFDYFDEQIEMVYHHKTKPYNFRSYFDNINPDRDPVDFGGIVTPQKQEAEIIFLRKQIFVINAVRIVIEKRFEKDKSLRIAVTILNELLYSKIQQSFRLLGAWLNNAECYRLASIITNDLRRNFEQVANFLEEILIKEGIKSEEDSRDTVLFMDNSLETPLGEITQNQIKDMFQGNLVLAKLCINLHYECYRLFDLAVLDKFQQLEETIQDTEITEEKTTNRRIVITLMLLTFGRIDKPEDITKEQIVRFFQLITGIPQKSLQDLLANPTKHKGKPRSAVKITEDLNFVRDELGKLGITDKVQSVISEIEFILEAMNENDSIDDIFTVDSKKK